MKTRRNWLVGASVALVCSAGCLVQPQQPAATQSPAAMPSAEQQPAEAGQQTVPVKVDQMEAAAGSPDLLAAKTESYTRELAALVEQRTRAAAAAPAPAAAPSPAPAPAPAAPSKVEWLDAADFRLGATALPSASDRAASPGAPIVRAVLDTKPSAANTGASADAPAEVAVAHSSDVVQTAMTAATITEVTPSKPIEAISSDALADRFAKRVKDDPRDVASHLEYQLLQFLKDEPTPQLATLSSLPPEDRELVTTVLDGLTNFRNALRADNNMLLSRKIKPLMDMDERLRSQADLTVSNIVLCRSVDRFGKYDPIDPPRFAAGKEQKAIVYCEIANFLSTLNDAQLWETRLTWDMTLYAEQGMSVWSDKTDKVSEASRSRLHDFFVRKAITIPQTLPIGRYLLKVTIVDTQSNRVAEATVPLLVAVE